MLKPLAIRFDEAIDNKPPTVARHDVGALINQGIGKDGMLRATVTATRPGVFIYRKADGSIRRELRHPDDVYSERSMASLAMVPVTRGHPPTMLDSTNARTYMIGSTGSQIEKRDGWLLADLLLTDKSTIDDVVSGAMAEASCGYNCQMDETPGEWQGQRYDARQTEIWYNHVAVVSSARAGPGARVRLDANDAEQVSIDTRKDEQMVKLKLGNTEVEVEAGAASLIQSRLDALDKDVADAKAVGEVAKKSADEHKARADAAEAEITKLKKERTDSMPERAAMEKTIRARLDLEGVAKKVLGSEVKFDAADTDRKVREQVLAKLSPDLKCDGETDDYVRVAFDFAMKQEATRVDHSANLGRALLHGSLSDTANDREKAIKERMDEEQNAFENYRKASKAA